jgi:hypothetical protein
LSSLSRKSDTVYVYRSKAGRWNKARTKNPVYKDLPILCVVIYLFRCRVEMLPYIIECAEKRSVVFDYDVIRLWEVESEWIVERHLIILFYTPSTPKEGRKLMASLKYTC